MKVVRVVGYHQNLSLAEAPEPQITSALDVIVKVGAAGVCRTDIHILEGQWADKSQVQLPYTIGHENAGWVHAIGDGVTNVQVGDKVILHPLVTCGLCTACRSGDDVHCESSTFPGINVDGGYAEYLKTTARSVIKLDDNFVHQVKKLTNDKGAEAVIDFVAEGGSTATGVKMLRQAGNYFVVGYGENLNIPTIDIISTEINFIGNLVGSYNDLAELMVLAAQGKVVLHTTKYKLEDFQRAIDDLSAGKVRGRAILVP
ncbi:alcohol dehydrogenase [Teratosphaeria destructans]|uniref:Alcohol dehydrogenase n=1 Tax=Teratosphaeria destructans TaxID=418781 RepID=A0A9W7SMT2_9PEZI|nr:alcohol dehydrogenase [Teratosphaeria destructans]